MMRLELPAGMCLASPDACGGLPYLGHTLSPFACRCHTLVLSGDRKGDIPADSYSLSRVCTFMRRVLAGTPSAFPMLGRQRCRKSSDTSSTAFGVVIHEDL